jgi:hypothetical protein
VTRQNLGQHQGKRFPAATALPAIGTKHPLAPKTLASGLVGIVAAQEAVPVQGLGSPAAGTALLLEGKSAAFSAGSSRTKWKGRWNIHSCCRIGAIFVELFLDGTADGATQVKRIEKRGRTARTALRPDCHRKLSRSYDPNSAQTRHFLRRHCGT